MRILFFIFAALLFSTFPKKIGAYCPKEKGHIPALLRNKLESPIPNCTVEHLKSNKHNHEKLKLCCAGYGDVYYYFELINGKYINTSQKTEENNNIEILHPIRTLDNNIKRITGDQRVKIKNFLTENTSDSSEAYEEFEGSSKLLNHLLAGEHTQNSNTNYSRPTKKRHTPRQRSKKARETSPKKDMGYQRPASQETSANTSWQQPLQPEEEDIDDYSFYENDNENFDQEKKPTTLSAYSDSWLPYILGGGFGLLVLWEAYYLIHNAGICARYLYGEDLWSSWKPEETYETLLCIKPKYLANDLMNDILVKYYEKENPVELFLEDVREEYETLLKWLQFRNTASMLKLPLGSDFYTIENRLKLLDHMRRALNFWRAQQIEKKNSSRTLPT